MIIKRGTPPPGGDKHFANGMVFVCPCCKTEFIPTIYQYRQEFIDICSDAYCPVCNTQHCYKRGSMYPYEPKTIIDVLKEMLGIE